LIHCLVACEILVIHECQFEPYVSEVLSEKLVGDYIEQLCRRIFIVPCEHLYTGDFQQLPLIKYCLINQ